MLRKYRIFLVLLSCFAMFTACEKEYSVENSIPGGGGIGGGGGVTQGSFRAKIDGVQWTANRIKSASRMSGRISIGGTSSDGKNMVLAVADSGVHNYQFVSTSSSNAGAYTDSSLAPIASLVTNQWVVDSTYGNVNITTIDEVRKTMSGTFKMYVIRALDGIKRNITEGVFTDIPYSTSLPPSSSTDSFTVKVDGVEFLETSIFGLKANGLLNFSATTNASATVGINLPENITPGTYTLGSIGTNYVGQYNPNSSTFLVASPGTITVLEHNTTTKRLRATFSFSARPFGGITPGSAELTDGYISAGYQ